MSERAKTDGLEPLTEFFFYQPRNRSDGDCATAFVRLTKGQALQVIASLADQMVSNNPNSGRAEHFLKDSKGKTVLFTVAVIPGPSK